ncbi:MAG: 2-hydroxyglutaryl-CoA dehydratase [Deltaproteobacteria bacterium]|nr:MAG: 2-hydroxyglutaryl-CoA dehydratase [Deltaproteobacteria bacterium]
MAQDHLVAGALSGLGYKVASLPCPDDVALRYGKEFGSRGQCNPTWFTVGNLVKHLVELRDRHGMRTEDIIERYVFLTSGSCGPCRFGMYVTEYRKALRDAGFEGFRVMLFQMNGGIKQASGDENEAPKGLVFDPKFFWAIAKALFIGDALNVIGYRLRPYEVEPGATDRALEDAKGILYAAFEQRTSLLVALLRARATMARVKVDRLAVKPKVSLLGEFWAMTTEGDGSYEMQHFLEQEGAEVDIQTVAQWIKYMVWEAHRDTTHRETLRVDDAARKGLAGKDPWKKRLMLRGADLALRGLFQGFGNVLGLHGYRLPDIQELADISSSFYNHDVRGGEAFLEVGKLISNIARAKVNMTISIKPFGCMPSSGVSDGVQSAITELYPEGIFLPIETTGDGAVNVYSRVQMMLFKARQAARRELDDVLEAYGMSEDEVRRLAARLPLVNRATFKAPHRYASTAADTAELVGALRHPLKGLKRFLGHARHTPEFRTQRRQAATAA